MINLFAFLPIGNLISDLFAFGTQPNSLGELISRAIEVILVFAIILALIYLIIGALKWITSEGKPDKLETARNNIVQALTGLVIAIAAFAIWLLVVKQFLGIDITGGINLGVPGTSQPSTNNQTGTCARNIPIGSCGLESIGGPWYRCLAPGSSCPGYTRTYDYPFLCPDPNCPD